MLQTLLLNKAMLYLQVRDKSEDFEVLSHKCIDPSFFEPIF
jgi:hypothetical protein